MAEQFLPMFPLKLVAFPGEQVNLHIFEPRYKQLIGECRDLGRPFGIPPFVEGRIADCGTQMVLEKVVREYPNGEMDIVTRGTDVFHVESFLRVAPGKLYGGGSVRVLVNDPKPDALIVEEIADLFRRFHTLLNTGHTRGDFYVENISYAVANEIGLSFEQRVALLGLPREADREQLILDHLRHVVPVLEAAETTRRRIQANGTFHKHPTLEL